MDFESPAQKACYEKIGPWLKELFGEFVAPRPDAPLYVLFVGSAAVQIAVFPWGEDDSVISTFSFVVTGAELTPELMKDLLRRNLGTRFGAFGLNEQGAIMFVHTIVGSSCDKNELKASVRGVLATADQSDDEIIARWGGQRATDRT